MPIAVRVVKSFVRSMETWGRSWVGAGLKPALTPARPLRAS